LDDALGSSDHDERVVGCRFGAMPVASYADLAVTIRDRPAQAGVTRVVAVDGPAGSGKSIFAERLGTLLSATVVCLDDLTPAWTGPDKEAAILVEHVLRPLAARGDARYQRFDWVRNEYAEWRQVPGEPTLLVEGVGAGSRIVRPYLSLLIWVEAPTALRLVRGLERDGEAYRPQWERWREREDRLFEVERTRGSADLRVDGAPAVAHEPRQEYVTLD
jgi:uridine kinase